MIAHSHCWLSALEHTTSMAAAAAIVLGLAGIGAHAAATGSFTSDCRGIVDDGLTVRADCKKPNGSWAVTSLAYKICEADISNSGGILQCTPRGSFKNSCSSIAWNESSLMANCQRNGRPELWNSDFNYNECLSGKKDIANCNGSLRCGGC